MRSWLCSLLLAVPGIALAGYPDDISLTQLGTYDGVAVTDTAVKSAAYATVVRTLGVAIANKALLPAETLGVSGFDVSLTNSTTFIDAYDQDQPTAWQRVNAEGDPTRVIWVPSLGVRKGLPLSLEIGGNVGYLAFSRQTVVGGYGRWALIEGYRSFAPDLTVQVGYTRYVGNEELQLGVMDASMTVGYTLGISQLEGINHGTFSPFLGVGMNRIHAAPRMSEEDAAALGLAELPCADDAQGSAICDEGYNPLALSLGFQVQSNDFFARLGAGWSPGTMPTTSLALGLSY